MTAPVIGSPTDPRGATPPEPATVPPPTEIGRAHV